MEIIGVIIAGIIIGLLGKFVAPGDKDNIPLWLTILCGIGGVILGWFIYTAFGGNGSPGIDWVRWLIAIAVAAGAVSPIGPMGPLALGRSGRAHHRRQCPGPGGGSADHAGPSSGSGHRRRHSHLLRLKPA